MKSHFLTKIILCGFILISFCGSKTQEKTLFKTTCESLMKQFDNFPNNRFLNDVLSVIVRIKF